MKMETVAEGSQDRRLWWRQMHRQQRRIHEAVAVDVDVEPQPDAVWPPSTDYQVTQVTMKFVWGE